MLTSLMMGSFLGAESFLYYCKPKICLWFELFDPGLDTPHYIQRYFNVESLDQMPRGKERLNSPRFRVGCRSALARELGTVFPEKYGPFSLPSDIPRALSGLMVDVDVKQSKYSQKRVLITERFRESRIVTILGVSDEEPSAPPDTKDNLADLELPF